jgi:hypothetical protein
LHYFFHVVEPLKPKGLQNEASKQRRPSRAYLLKQKATGEETIVTLMPIHGNLKIKLKYKFVVKV